ncbi:protein transport protein Sec16A isoform X1 [Cervus elaphus]|uniref:protein transport protein Sec16A isoform X1 n=1 Tax=Cervus elaphus TaxID=9860 RepID=UPI001CC2B54C|nr:protein transport protein Sec16A isoform X1 [Cervus elaphus]XP_043772294.1 protein transport protein Sec16A isoform X1 [Cervus elaphus]
MQPPPQAVPSGVVGPPPSGSPQTMFWSNSPYRRQAGSHTPMAPITCPLQPVTDPFAFSRQALQNTSLGGSSKSSPPILQGPAPPPSLPRAGLPVPHTSAGDSSQGPCEPLPGPPLQPRADASLFPGVPAPSAPHGPETNRSAETPGPEPELLNAPYPPQYIPGVGSSGSRGGLLQGHVPRPDRPLSRPSPPDSTVPPAALPLPPQPHQQVPGQWGPGQGGPRPPGQHYWPGPEGAPQIPGPHASSVTHFPPPSSLHQRPGHEQLGPPASLPGPSASDGRNEAVCLPSEDHSVNSFDPESAFRQNSRAGNPRANQELRSSPGVNREQLSGLAPVNPLTQENSPESHSRHPLGAGGGWAPPEAGSGALAMFFKGGETENEENLSSETAGSAGQADMDGFCLGQLPAHVGVGGAYQAFPRGSSSEPAQLGGEPQRCFPRSAGSPHEKAASKAAAMHLWADTARAGSQYENVENLEFVQNQEVLPSEPLSMDPSSPGDPLKCGPLPGPAGPRLGAVGPAAGGGPNLEALDVTAHSARSDSASSSYSSKSQRGLPGAARPHDSGTFIQQEVGKPEDESPGRFFKQIDSSPVGGETDEITSQNYHGSLSQPSTPSPPKPTGIFQTSANSSFEPVKSHLVGVKPVEADRANVVGEVRGPSAHQKQHRVAATMPDAAPGNLEQPPDNMETLSPPQLCVLPLATPMEAGQGLLQAAGPPLETVLPTPEKRSSTRVQGPVKCESPATTLWAQNELPDFGGNVLLAPAAPALHVPARPQLSEVIQPPDEGMARQVGPGVQSGDGLGASENLENPPQLGEEEALPLQAGPGYASLLSSPPTESLQNQPVLIAQPDQSYNLAQPVNVSVSLPNPNEKTPSWRDSSVGDKPAVSSWAAGGDPGENVPLSGMPAGSLLCSPLPNHLAQSPFPQVSGIYDMVSNPAANLLVQPHSHPKASLPEGQKVYSADSVPPEGLPSPAGGAGLMLVPPASSTSVPDSSKPGVCGGRDVASGALDFTFGRTLENPAGMYSPAHADGLASGQQTTASHRPPGPGANTPDRFYQQVMKEAQDQPRAERAQQELAPPLPAPQGPRAALPEPSNPGSPPVQAQPPDPARPSSPALADVGQQLLSRPPQSSSASVVSTSSSQAAPRPDQQWLQPPPPDLASYYYYRSLYDGWQPPYPSPYPPDPGPAPHYYQDMYSLYDPRYRPCDSAAYVDPYRYPEPERPSSRASHCSDRPAARQAYPEGYYNSKSGWSSQSDYYAGYYPSQYDYGDPGRWDRFYYGSRFRDPRAYDRRYWYDAEYDSCRKENYAYGDRPEKYDDRYRYDPRFTGSFDDEPEPPRDPYGEEADRHSEHSQHSARSLRSAPSLPSRRSSFSAHSHQSQVYRSHNTPAGSYEVPPAPGSFHGDYAYGPYGSDFHGAPGFPEYGYPTEASWPSVEQAPSRPSSPEKFSVPHVCARFGPGGQLIKVIPNLPSEGQPALVEIHSMETLLQHTPEQEEMRAFPGPLGKDDTHKVDVINFAQNKATKCLQNENLIDKESASLLWSFIVLLCRQNGTVVGTDIAELLLRDHRTVWLPGKSPNEANLIDFTNEAVEQVEEESGEAQLSFLTDSQAASTLEKDTERFRELLLYGRKKDALESAMKNGLWGHALLLASKMDSRTHARVMTRFANSLPINDPLQTVYQLMSGRMPAASTCCGDEKWGDWRPHLAMILSNLSSNVDVESRAMATMGDTLASKGLLDAAHFCYLMAQVGFGVYTKKTTKLVLIGSNHSLPFLKFATNEAIQRTEAYEFAQSLGAQTCSLPSFQVFKFIYCCRLAEMGLATQAFHYCEAIAKSVLAEPHRHSPVLLRQLAQVASQLRLFDPQLKEKPEEEASAEPAWLAQLRLVERQAEEGAVAWSQDGACPPRCSSSPSPEGGPRDGPGPPQLFGLGADNPLLAPPAPSAELFSQDVRLLPSAPLMLPDGPPVVPTRVPMLPVPLPGPVELGPVHGPPGAVPGFAEPSGPDPVALYPGPGVPTLQDTDRLLPEARSQDAGAAPQETPGRSSHSEPGEEEFGGNFANMGSFRTSPGSEAPPHALQPPAPLTPAAEVQRPVQAAKKESKEPKKSSESWFSRWLPVKKRTEAYLPDDKNKSIVWDEKKNRWVDVNEPEEEKKAPPPPPAALPKAPHAAHPGPGGPPRPTVNMYSRKAAGTRARYVDILNPGGPQRSESALAPTDLFAPLAPLPIPAHLLGPNTDAEEVPSTEGAGREGPARPEPASDPKQVFGPAVASLPGPELPASGLDGPQGGELSRCSSLSSLSREVSQHFDQAPGAPAPAGAPSGAAVPFYNPAQLAQAPATSGSSRTGRIGQRKYPALS